MCKGSCINRLGFKEFFFESELYLLDEISKNELMNKTDPKRIRKAIEEVKKNPPLVKSLKDGKERIEFNFKANPSVEFKRHWGYVDHKDGDITELFCDCKDFHFRLRKNYVDKELAVWELPKKYKKREPLEHTQEPTDITNPDRRLYVCKHIFALLRSYF